MEAIQRQDNSPFSLFQRVLESPSASQENSFLLELPLTGQAWMGFDPVRVVTYDHQVGFQEKVGDKSRQIAPPDDEPLQKLAQYIDLQKPHFFLISHDLVRNYADKGLPLFVIVQPNKEIIFNDGVVTESSGFEDAELQAIINSPESDLTDFSSLLKKPILQDGWATESDERFVQRLDKAISQLQNNKDKMVVMRGYSKRVRDDLDCAELYGIYSQLEPVCSAGHIAYLSNKIISLGRSPENIFEVNGKELCFDVMASTRGVSSDPVKDSNLLNELLTDPKEQREHEMVIQRLERCMLNICKEEKMSLDKKKEVREFRHVRHMHSKLSATIKDDCSYMDIINGMFPPLQSYTKELVQLSDIVTEPLRYYGGMVGYLNGSKSVAKCFLNIRSALCSGNMLYTHGGVGVVQESVAKNECLEVKNKLCCLMESIGIWENL